jgi:hypothetical protein
MGIQKQARRQIPSDAPFKSAISGLLMPAKGMQVVLEWHMEMEMGVTCDPVSLKSDDMKACQIQFPFLF